MPRVPDAVNFVNDEEALLGNGQPLNTDYIIAEYSVMADPLLLRALCAVPKAHRVTVATHFELTGKLPDNIQTAPVFPANYIPGGHEIKDEVRPPSQQAQGKVQPQANLQPQPQPQPQRPSALPQATGVSGTPAAGAAGHTREAAPRPERKAQSAPGGAAPAAAGAGGGATGPGAAAEAKAERPLFLWFRTRSWESVREFVSMAKYGSGPQRVEMVFPKVLLDDARRQESVHRAVGKDPSAKDDKNAKPPYPELHDDGRLLYHPLGDARPMMFAHPRNARLELKRMFAVTGELYPKSVDELKDSDALVSAEKRTLRCLLSAREDRADAFGGWTLERFGENDSFWVVELPTRPPSPSPATIRITPTTSAILCGIWAPNDLLYAVDELDRKTLDRLAPAVAPAALELQKTDEQRQFVDAHFREKAEWNKTLLFLTQYAPKTKRPPLLREDVVNHATDRLVKRELYSGLMMADGPGRLLEGIEHWLNSFLAGGATAPSRGMCLYGPPGTGKTHLLKNLIPYCGFATVTTDRILSCSDFAGGLVGSTERSIRAALSRGWITPYLPVMLVVDEIDGFCPDREKLDSEHMKSQVNTFITFWQGGADKDENVLIASGTNFLPSIDKACDRRLQTKLFIGLPSPEDRGKLLRACTGVQFTRQLTTNFSGANMSKLLRELETIVKVSRHRRRIGVKAPARAGADRWDVDAKREDMFATITEKEFRTACERVCKEDNITLGSYSFSELLASDDTYLTPRGYDMLRQLSRTVRDKPSVMTGTILVNEAKGTFEVRMEGKAQRRDQALHTVQVLERKPEQKRSSALARVLATATHLSSERSFYAVRLISTDGFYANKVTDEMEMVEKVTDMFRELEEYPSWIVVVDFDSLAIPQPSGFDKAKELEEGVAVANEPLIRHITELAMRKGKVTESVQQIVVVVSSDSRLVARFKRDTRWPQTELERQQKAEDMHFRECAHCHGKYQQCKNGDDACTYHPPEAKIININTRKTMSFDDFVKNWRADKVLQNPNFYEHLRWTCCQADVKYNREQGAAAGTACRRAAHRPIGGATSGVGVGSVAAGLSRSSGFGASAVGGGSSSGYSAASHYSPLPNVQRSKSSRDDEPHTTPASGAAAAAASGSGQYAPLPHRPSKSRPDSGAAAEGSARAPSGVAGGGSDGSSSRYEPLPNRPRKQHDNSPRDSLRGSAGAAAAGAGGAVQSDAKGRGQARSPDVSENSDNDWERLSEAGVLIDMAQCELCSERFPVEFAEGHEFECKARVPDTSWVMRPPEQPAANASAAAAVRKCVNCGLTFGPDDAHLQYAHYRTCNKRPNS